MTKQEQLTEQTDELAAANKLEPAIEEPVVTESGNSKLSKPHRWQPGESGNPLGRPKKENSLTTILARLVDKHDLGVKLLKLAMDDTTPALQLEAIKYIYSRIEGTPVQSMRHSTDGSIGAMIFLHPGREVIDGESKLIE